MTSTYTPAQKRAIEKYRAKNADKYRVYMQKYMLANERSTDEKRTALCERTRRNYAHRQEWRRLAAICVM